MLLSTTLSFAIAATTETQFADGTTSFSHTFAGQGNGGTAGVNMPYGSIQQVRHVHVAVLVRYSCGIH